MKPYVLNSQRNSCVCPYGQGFTENGCATCLIPNCASCHFYNDAICNKCGNNYVPVDNFTKCACPDVS